MSCAECVVWVTYYILVPVRNSVASWRWLWVIKTSKCLLNVHLVGCWKSVLRFQVTLSSASKSGQFVLMPLGLRNMRKNRHAMERFNLQVPVTVRNESRASRRLFFPICTSNCRRAVASGFSFTRTWNVLSTRALLISCYHRGALMTGMTSVERGRRLWRCRVS